MISCFLITNLIEIIMVHLSWFISFLFSVVIDAGSRYEVDYPAGLSHLLEKLAFQVKSYMLVSFFPRSQSLKSVTCASLSCCIEHSGISE